ncbi:MAG: DinB family protein [Candidatus Krumholzibacteriia bacterium]
MHSIDLIRENPTRSRDRVLAHVEDMRDHALVFPTVNGGGHTLWVLGHLAYIEALVVEGFMLGRRNLLAAWEEPFDGAGTSADPTRYPPFDEVRATCREQRERTLALLATLGEADLDGPSANTPTGFADTFGTSRHCLQYVADHWYMHRGQLADAPRRRPESRVVRRPGRGRHGGLLPGPLVRDRRGRPHGRRATRR